MRGVRPLLALALGAALIPAAPAAAAKGQEFGVFATINGKPFKAVGTGKATDPCVNGTYETGGGVVFGALECRGRHRRSRKNAKLLSFACGVIDPNAPPPTPPFDALCVAAGYTETRTRRGIPVSMKEWLSNLTLQPGAGGALVEQSSVTMRIESFDGTYVRGTFSGVFDLPQQPGAPAQAPISGEGRFYFPVRGIAP